MVTIAAVEHDITVYFGNCIITELGLWESLVKEGSSDTVLNCNVNNVKPLS